MLTHISQIHSHLSPRRVRPFELAADAVDQFPDLSRVGIHIDPTVAQRMMSGLTADAFTDPTLPANITTPIQFLQQWLPGFVYTMTQPRTIDTLIGVTTLGAPEDEEIIQPTLEHVGTAALYGDNTNYSLAGVGNGYERRTVVRTEIGLRVTFLESRRAGRASIDDAAEKRAAAGLALEIQRNRIGFYGFNNGANRTYGFLNDPNLPAYVTVATGGGGGTTWASKTFLEITADIRLILGALLSSSKGLIDIRKAPITLAVSLASVNQLTKTNEYGMSVEDWLAKTYPNVRVEASVDLDGANGGANVMYAYAETVPGSGTDGGRVIEQFVPTKFMVQGSSTTEKSYNEAFLSATAGVMVKRPYGVRRYSGI